MNFVATLLSQIPNLILVLVTVLTVSFFVLFFRRYLANNQGINAAISGLEAKLGSHVGQNPRDLDAIFAKQPLLHIWNEYSDTLHPMRLAISGQTPVLEYRSSMPAEMMFTKESLVDGPLFDDFWRHLPGILTGLGIIGTFAGLLDGLDSFKGAIATNTSDAVAGLGPLLGAVTHAFSVSAVAIFCAMLVVFVSRLSVAKLNSRVEHLCDLIDSLYKSGAGEEYLQRLVESSEKSEVHTAQLKDALVEDLTRLMTNLTERQIQAQISAGQHIGETVGRSIAESIAEPMQRVREVMENNAAGNTAQVNTMLETMLTGFMAKLEDTFGGQINGINEQMQRSMAAMGSVQTSLQALVQDIQKANENAATQMSDKLAAAMQTASENQQQLTKQMTQFVTDFRSLVAEEQRKSKDAMNETIAGLLSEVGKSIASMEASRKSASEEDATRTKVLTDQTGQMVSGLSANVEELLRAVSDQVLKTQESINAIHDVSMRAVDGMNQGALTMGSAAQRFETAGSSVTRALDDSAAFIEQVKASSSALQAASLAVNNGFEKYDATRKTVDSQVLTLTGLIESAKREAGVSQQLIEGVESSVKALRAAEEESRRNLSAVNDQLVSAFETFGNSLVSQVQRVVGETDKNISVLSNQLTGVVQELAQFMQRMRKQ
ncbi:MAG: anti-phage ZorAB system protein ZorA [Betaproteobacteria bacterium]